MSQNPQTKSPSSDLTEEVFERLVEEGQALRKQFRKDSSRAEKVNHPAHYGTKEDPYEAIKVIEAWDLDFHLGNVIKYIARAGKKGNELEDLEKAVWYLNRRIKRLKSNRA